MSRKIAIALLFVTLPLAAQKRGTSEVSVMATNITVTSSSNTGTDLDGDFGLGFNYWLNRHWSTELQVSYQQHSVAVSSFERRNPDGTIFLGVIRRTATAYPVDLRAQYHFLNDTRWKPFVGAGVHYVQRPDGVESREFHASDFSPEITGGTLFMFTPRLGLRLDSTLLLREDSADWDNNFKVGVGVSWRF